MQWYLNNKALATRRLCCLVAYMGSTSCLGLANKKLEFLILATWPERLVITSYLLDDSTSWPNKQRSATRSLGAPKGSLLSLGACGRCLIVGELSSRGSLYAKLAQSGRWGRSPTKYRIASAERIGSSPSILSISVCSDTRATRRLCCFVAYVESTGCSLSMIVTRETRKGIHLRSIDFLLCCRIRSPPPPFFFQRYMDRDIRMALIYEKRFLLLPVKYVYLYINLSSKSHIYTCVLLSFRSNPIQWFWFIWFVWNGYLYCHTT